MSDDMDVADVLDAAADYITTHGWKQGSSGGGGHSACALGAIAATGEKFDSACTAMKRTLTRRGPAAIEEWNDRRNRTADEVVEMMREAAARVRTGEIKP